MTESYDEVIIEKMVIEKGMRRLTPHLDYVIGSLRES